MKALKFQSNLVKPILSKKKTVTWRLFDDKDLRISDHLELIDSGTGKKFGEADVTSCQEKRIDDLSDNDLKENNYRDKEHVIKINRELYGDRVDGETVVKIIWFNICDK